MTAPVAPELLRSGPGQAYVRVVADSIAPTGDRVTSFEVNGWRFTLAEWNTHSLFVRNSASSRAIPLDKQLERYLVEPAWPHSWPREQKGMSGGAELEGTDLQDARLLFADIHAATFEKVWNYRAAHPDKERRLHKSLVNRLLEPLQWHKMLITASSYENFFDQRANPAAQPELRVCAELMKELYELSEPERLQRGEWHTPYVAGEEKADIINAGFDPRKISTARCARTSYMTQDGIRDWSEDLRLYNDTLLGGGHMSPFAHVATPDPRNVIYADIDDPDTGDNLGVRRVSVMGQFVGWQQWRHVIEGRRNHVSQR